MSTYGRDDPEYLEVAINSMLNQTIPPDQIVIIEDGEIPNDLQKVIMDFRRAYPQIFRVGKNKENLGLGISLRNGLKLCRNELVARMDADDIARVDRCEKQLRFMEKHPEISIVGGQIQEFCGLSSNVVGKRIVPLTDSDIKTYMKKRCPFNHMTVMFRKQAVEKAGEYKHWPYNEDYYLWIRMALAGLLFANLQDILVDVRVGRNMYKRRGGISYFKSELGIQRLMLKKYQIDFSRFSLNILERFLVQVVLPDYFREIIYMNFARE